MLKPETLSDLYKRANEKYQGSKEQETMLFVRENLTEQFYLSKLANNYANFAVFRRLARVLNVHELMPSVEDELLTVENWRDIITAMEKAIQDPSISVDNFNAVELAGLENDFNALLAVATLFQETAEELSSTK